MRPVVDAELTQRGAVLRPAATVPVAVLRSAGRTRLPALEQQYGEEIHYIIRGVLGRAVRWRHLGVNKAEFAVASSLALSMSDT